VIFCSEQNRLVREHFDVHADELLRDMANGLKTAIAQLQAELVFTLGTKTPIAFVTSSKFRALVLFLGVYFGVGFERIHGMPRNSDGHGRCHTVMN
jgi:hypothetical protein